MEFLLKLLESNGLTAGVAIGLMFLYNKISLLAKDVASMRKELDTNGFLKKSMADQLLAEAKGEHHRYENQLEDHEERLRVLEFGKH